MPSSEDTIAFARKVFDKVPHRKPYGGLSSYEEQEREATRLAKKQCKYKLILDDVGDDESDELPMDARKKRSRKAGESHGSEDDEEPTLKRSEALEAIDISNLRKASRQAYLKKRRNQKLVELKDEIIDDEYLFGDGKRTEAEERELRCKKKVYALANENLKDIEDVSEYRMPEAYDQDGSINQEKRFGVALKRYRDANDGRRVKPFAEQEEWEEHQIRKGSLNYGSQDKHIPADDYQYVFEDGIDFVKVPMMNGIEYEDEFGGVTPNCSIARSKLQKLQDERKTLPIYSYREELLQAIEDHQVIVIVGETGSGKTTQIPQYLHEAGYTKHGKIACTQPRRVAAMSVAARVSEETGTKLGHEVGYSIRFEDCTSEKTVIKYMTDGMLLREFVSEPDLASYCVLMIDEAHERTISTDILFGLVKDIARFWKDLKLLISSATLDAEKFSDYFDSAPIFMIPGRKFHVDIYFTQSPEADYIDAAIVTVLQIHINEPPGDILVFLTGQEEIETVGELLRRRTSCLGSKIKEIIICPIYANLPTELQAKIFQPTPKGSRKVVLATNIAEASLTIDGIKYVVDPGFVKVKSYYPRTGMESLLVIPISKASAIQRAGRAGRTAPGKCYRLYTAYGYERDLKDNNVPEILRTNLTHVVLVLKRLGIHDLANYDFMDPPPLEALFKALEELFALGALNDKGELTKIGRQMVEFPLDPKLSKMIIASDKYQCSAEIITIAAMLTTGNSISYRPKELKVHAENAWLKFHQGNVGDHIGLLNVYNSWKENNFSSQWCYDNFIQVRSMKRARDIREQLEGLLEQVEIEHISNPNDFDAIKKAIASGFFHHSAKLQRSGAYQTVKNPCTVFIHGSSSLYKERPQWLIYHELVLTKRKYIRQVTELKPEWLIEIAPHYYQLADI
ncbi:pre-mRNA-splicing factor ATP-dependent RNA helicase DEAH1-like [Asparagus officinalis]|uniref:pre-mRNA-splicing factor ATP-dependent RNA helicase DEAH1-like n=1 Tax=Asparagus officinalis TaxID=4686 RepID=UPI00098E2354|nr:pre-mRNA-splicing factor ATP-dependent RNA helicase DEAH1-like [Asparagus officinalis]